MLPGAAWPTRREMALPNPHRVLHDARLVVRGVPMRARAITAASLAALAATAAAAGPIEELDGYWSGSGTVVLSEGSERVKCAVRYKVGQGGTQIKQTMRCASADYSINATAELAVSGAQIAGNWEEKTYSASGQVSGRYTGSTFVLSIKGANFSAAMHVGLSSCKQSITIHPRGLEVRRISMNLAKC
jgi:uncharacterized protein (DUF2147 family)